MGFGIDLDLTRYIVVGVEMSVTLTRGVDFRDRSRPLVLTDIPEGGGARRSMSNGVCRGR